jgi:hypothetical protein
LGLGGGVHTGAVEVGSSARSRVGNGVGLRSGRHEMGCVLAYDDGRWLRSHTRLLMNRLPFVVVVVCGCSKRMATRQGTRSILRRVLAGELALHVAGHVFWTWGAVTSTSYWQSARHHGRSCLSWKLRKAVAANLPAEAPLRRLGTVDNVAPVAASLRQTSRPLRARRASPLTLPVLILTLLSVFLVAYRGHRGLRIAAGPVVATAIMAVLGIIVQVAAVVCVGS